MTAASTIENHRRQVSLDWPLSLQRRYNAFSMAGKDNCAASADPECRGDEWILVVDDDRSQCKSIRMSLEHFGYQVTAVTEGDLAIRLFEEAARSGGESPFDLVFIDMVLGGTDGLDTLKKILYFFPAQKAIVSTGYADEDRCAATIEMGAAWLSKPFRIHELVQAVRSRLDRS